MEKRHRLLRLVIESLVVIVILTTSVVGTGPFSVASAHPVPQRLPSAALPSVSPAGASGASVLPDQTAPGLSVVGAWYAPHSEMSGPLYGPYASGTPTAAQGRKPGEQPDLRTATSDTYLNADGTWTLKSYPVPINYQDAQGHWQPIDTTLVSDTSDVGYAYGNKANSWHVHFAPQAGGPTLVHAQFPGVMVAETLTGAAKVPAIIKGSTVVYAGVFPGVDLRYGVGSLTLEETLLLQHVQAPSSFTFTYHLPGASAAEDAAGHVVFTDAKGKVLLVIGDVLMYEADAQGQMRPAGAMSDQVKLTLAGTGPDFTITYIPNQTWLNDPTRHFPVAIDPIWQGGDSGQNTTNGNIYADTFDESGNPNTIFWTVNSERIGNANVIGLCCNGTSRTYLKFPINPPPAGVRVTSADLALYQSSQNTGGGVQINANLILSAWNATQLTWNNHPTNFNYGGIGYTAATQNTWVHINVSQAVYQWWQAGVALNGFELQYNDESKPQEFFFSDNNSNSSQRPLLTINYVQDKTNPGGGLAFNGGASAGTSNVVTVAPAGSDAGALESWSSNWTTVNGVGTNGGFTATANSADGMELNANTSSCGSTSCWAQTYFTHPLTINTWPTFTAAFKTDTVANFHFGVISNDNANTRFDLSTSTSSTAFTYLEYSTSAGAYGLIGINVPISANTWYFGEVDFPLPNIGEIFIWPAGQLRPATPSVQFAGIYMTNPALNFWAYGNNGSSLVHYTIGNVNMTSQDTNSGTTGYGIYAMQMSSDGTTWGCPPYGGGSSFSGGPWCVYSTQSFTWTFPAGDGSKTLYFKYVDNAGNQTTGTATFIVDTQAPTITSITPPNDQEVRGIVPVTVQTSDPPASDGSSSGVVTVSLYVDGVQAGSPVTGTATPTFLWDTTNLSQCVHTLSAQATDAAGNTGPVGGVTRVIVSNTALMPYETLAKRTLPDGQTSVSVNVANGDAVVTHQDLDIPGRGPDLAIGRTYHSLGRLNGLFGSGWTSDLDEGLTINGDGSVTYRDADGGIHVFLPNGSGGYLTSPGLYLALVKNADGTYTITARDQSRTNFSATGLLTSMVDRHGNTLTVTWNGTMPTTVTDAAGRQLTITTSGGHVTQITDPDARLFRYGYDGSGNLTSSTDPAGVVTQYGYDSSHRLTSITLNYVSGGAQDQQTNVTTTLTYDTNSADLAYNRLTNLVDPLGYVVNIGYTMQNHALDTLVQQQQGISPVTYENTYYLITTDGFGAIAALTDALNATTNYQYDANENVTQVIDPDNHVTSSTYDNNGNRLTHVVDPGSIPHLNLTTTWTYDGGNNVTSETDPRGIVAQYTYDSPTTGDLIKTVRNYINNGPTNSDTNVTTTSTYDSYGEVLTTTDPLGIVTKYTYDSQGDVLTTTANYQSGVTPDSQTNVTTSATYDVLGEKLTATNPLGIVTAYTYDSLGHLVQQIANYQANGPTDKQTNVKTLYGYDPLGRQVTVTNPLGVVTLTTYDKDGRVVSTTENYINGGSHDNQTNVVSMTATYDAAGNTLTSTDAKGNVTVTVYDLDNRAVQVTGKDNATPTPNILSNSKTVYDAAGFTVESDTLSLDGNNTILTKETYTYDNAGRRATQTDPAALSGSCGVLCTSNVTTTTYDADGNATDSKETNAAANPTTITESTATFDHLNRPLSKTEQANTSSAQTSSYTYDLDGRQLTMTDPSSKTTTVGYDALGRTLTVTHPDSTVDYTTYDAAGERLSQCNSAGITKDTYDPLGRVIYEERDTITGTCASPTLTFQSSVTTTYDANGNKLEQLTNYPGGTSSDYQWTYDPLNRPVTMSDGTRSYTYDMNGNITQIQVLNASQANIITQNITYDGANRLATLNAIVGSTTLHSYSYTYDAFGDRSQITTDGTATTYSYDNLTQLTKVQQGSTIVASYTYDANGNRATLVTSVGTTTYTYDSADVLLVSKTDPSGKVTNYTYDSNGNLTSAVYDPGGTGHLNQTTTYKYDTNNRLIEVDEPNGTIVTFTYDADGNRLSKTVNGTTISDVYALGHLDHQTDGSGNILATFTYDTNGEPTSVVVGNPTSGTRYYYVYNGHGDVVALVDTSGNVKASYSYDACGNLTSSSETLANGWSNPYRYVGGLGVRYDPETGLYWMSVRAYDPTLGRFISHDPLGRLAVQGVDNKPYIYTGNNPVNHTDPSGMFFISSGGSGGVTSLRGGSSSSVHAVQAITSRPHTSARGNVSGSLGSRTSGSSSNGYSGGSNPCGGQSWCVILPRLVGGYLFSLAGLNAAVVAGVGPVGALILSDLVRKIRSSLDSAIDNYHPSTVWQNIFGYGSACVGGAIVGSIVAGIINKPTGSGALAGCGVGAGVFGPGITEWFIEQQQHDIQAEKAWQDWQLNMLSWKLSAIASHLLLAGTLGDKAANQVVLTLSESDANGNGVPGDGSALHLHCTIPSGIKAQLLMWLLGVCGAFNSSIS